GDHEDGRLALLSERSAQARQVGPRALPRYLPGWSAGANFRGLDGLAHLDLPFPTRRRAGAGSRLPPQAHSPAPARLPKPPAGARQPCQVLVVPIGLLIAPVRDNSFCAVVDPSNLLATE